MDNREFAKLMATPKVRSGGNGDAAGEEKMRARSERIKKMVRAEQQRSKASKRKGGDDDDDNDGGAKEKKEHPQEKKRKAKEKKELKYRDRAEERRTDSNKDYATEVANLAEMDVETSKYLGGDVEHTHLVRGLDFALLQKIRSEDAKKAEFDEEYGGPAPKEVAPQKRAVEAWSPMARAVLAFLEAPAAAPAAARARAGAVRGTSLQYDLSGLALDRRRGGELPTTILRSAAERAALFDDHGGRTMQPMPPATLQRAVDAFVDGRRRKKKKKQALKDGTDAPAEMRFDAKPEPDDDDIFAGAGMYTSAPDEMTLAEKVAASRAASAAADDESDGEGAGYFKGISKAKKKPAPPPAAATAASKARTTAEERARTLEEELDDVEQRELEEEQAGASRPAVENPVGRTRKPKVKKMIHRDIFGGGGGDKAASLSRNFDGTDGGYGEAENYDSDDETYGAMKRRNQTDDGPKKGKKKPAEPAAAD
ncbi:RED-like protein N-terminal region-domain-containing protein [Pelagophyceae sp. CCMP2097]|nr:RED-like protein N-terminal region-domain-containing protein [Pelagophyceae sp. CCMP2097]